MLSLTVQILVCCLCAGERALAQMNEWMSERANEWKQAIPNFLICNMMLNVEFEW